jgi:outer membrane protein assembly factor BamD
VGFVALASGATSQIRYTFYMINHESKRIALALVLVAGLAQSACSTTEQVSPESSSAEQLYNSAKRSLNQGDFLTAVSTFETLGARFPFGNFTQQAQLDITYAYYKQDEHDNAIASADRFIKLYPRSENVDYAIYMKGLSHFARGSSFMERIFPRDMSKVNQNWLRASFAEFDSLVRQYPQSEYVADSLERMEYLRNQMAKHELATAQFYYDRGAMVAAINRVSYLLEHFDGSKHVPNALALMATAYESLGQPELQQETLRTLALTEPKHPALK